MRQSALGRFDECRVFMLAATVTPTVGPSGRIVKIKKSVPQAQHDHYLSELERGIGRHPEFPYETRVYTLAVPTSTAAIWGDGGYSLEFEKKNQDKGQQPCRD
jgi:hypothetical protein